MLREIDKKVLLLSPEYLKQKQYWLDKLSGNIAGTEFLPRNKTGNRSRKSWGKIEKSFPADLFNRLAALGKHADLSIYITLLSGLKSLIYRCTGNPDVIVISPVNKKSRHNYGLNDFLLIRDEIQGDMSFKQVLLRVRQSVLEAHENQDFPLGTVLEHLAEGSGSRGNGYFSSIGCALENIHESMDIEGIGAALWFSFSRGEGRLKAALRYDPGKYGQDFTSCLLDHLIALLEKSVQDIDIKISRILFLSDNEKRKLIHEFNLTEAAYPADRTICRIFAEQVEKGPHRTALVFKDSQVTYSRLDHEADRLARILQRKGVRPNRIVGVMMERSHEMVMAMLSILKAGGAYLPIDPGNPGNRVNFFLKDAGVPLLVTTGHIAGKHPHIYSGGMQSPGANVFQAGSPPHMKDPDRLSIPEHRCFEHGRGREIILMDEIPGHEHKQPMIGPPGNVTTVNKPGDLAYIIYTSGTTGNPKGVMIEHKNVVRLMINDKFRFEFSSSDVWTMFHSSSFDFSVWEMYGALLYGGKLIIIPEMVTVDFERYLQVLKKEGVSVLNQTPSAFYNLAAVEMKYPGRELKLKYVIFGGEALSPVKLKKWKEMYPGTKLINMFGITETTVHVTYKEISGEDILSNRSNIGKPLPTLRTYVMDKNLALLPVGAAGELWVGGDGVGRGYLNRPGLTGERFTSDPFKPGEKLYRSGDLVRLWENGEMEYIGRADHQVKIRGYRIELGEIEAQLLKHKEIIGAVIVSKEDKRGDKYLCAYFIPGNKIESAELRSYLSMHLPGHFIPSYFIQLDSIPLTANGKINHGGLPAPEVEAGADYRAPANEVEEILVEVWADVLNLKKDVISVDANFFELGGHSLKVMELCSCFHKQLGVKVTVVEIFQNPTIREQAAVITRMEKEKWEALEPAEEKDYYLLSSAQKRLYILQELEPDNTAYNIPYILPLGKDISMPRLECAFKQLIARHESLRTSFHMRNEVPVQRIHEQVEFKIEYYGASGSGQETGSTEALIKRSFRSFDLSRAPLLWVGLITTSEGTDILLLNFHHIIMDGMSHQVLEPDFRSLYGGEELPPLRIRYRDFSEWQNSENVRQAVKKQEEYWLKEFNGAVPVLDIPTDYPRPELLSFEGSSLDFVIGKEETRQLKELAKESDVTLYMLMLAIYNVFLGKLCKQEDIIVGTPVSGRNHADLEKIIGLFVNILPLRNYPSGSKTFLEFLVELKGRTLEAFENQEYSFDELVGNLSKARDASRSPIFDVMFNFLVREYSQGESEKKVADRPAYRFTYDTAKADLLLTGIDGGEELFFTVEYSSRLFKPLTIRRFIGYLKVIISSVPGNAGRKISEIKIISEDEKARLLDEVRNKKYHELMDDNGLVNEVSEENEAEFFCDM
jgi:amino acid adenylation domain-containing protein